MAARRGSWRRAVALACAPWLYFAVPHVLVATNAQRLGRSGAASKAQSLGKDIEVLAAANAQRLGRGGSTSKAQTLGKDKGLWQDATQRVARTLNPKRE